MDSWPINSVLFSSSILLLRLRFGFSLQCTTPMDEPITKADAAAALLHTAQTAATVEQARELFRQAQKDASDQNNIGVLLRVWLRWAEAEARRSQFKAAKRIYEDIVSHSTLSLLPASWLSYAGYCAGRGKVRDARKVYFRGCQMKLMEEDQSSVIWSAFLAFENAIRSSEAAASAVSTDGGSGSAGVDAEATRAESAAPNTSSTVDQNVIETTKEETPAAETPAVETPAAETPAAETPAAETPAAETPAAKTPAAETPTAVTHAAETPAASALLTLEELKALVAKTTLPPVEVIVEAVITPSDAIGEKFKAAEATGQVVQIEEDNDDHPSGGSDSSSTSSSASDIIGNSKVLGRNSNSTAAANKMKEDVIEIETSSEISSEKLSNNNLSNGVPLAIEQAAAQAAASEMLNYALPSGSRAPRLFVAAPSNKKKNATSSSSSSSSSSDGAVAQKLPRETLLKLGAALKKGGAKSVFRMVVLLRESQRLKEEELRARRQMTIKEYRTQIAMAWLNATTTTTTAAMNGIGQKQKKQKKQGAPPPPSLLRALAEKLKNDLERFDILARRELEAIRRQHQSICEKAGIPEMRPTSSSETLVLNRQRQILSVIEKAAKSV